MIGPGAAFAQARLQAAYAALPSEADWLQLRGARNLAAYLEEARHGPLRPWVRGFSSQSDAHAIDRGLRAVYTEEVERVADQIPRRWQTAIGCWRWLAYLPLFAQLQQGDALPDWAREDALVTKLLGEDGRLDRDRLEEQQLTELFAGDEDRRSLEQLWLDLWRQRLAPLTKGARTDIGHLVTRLQQHRQAFAGLASEHAWQLRFDLREELRLAFHRQSAVPVVAYLYLTLLALDLERLRRALLDRALFGGWSEASEPGVSLGRRSREPIKPAIAQPHEAA